MALSRRQYASIAAAGSAPLAYRLRGALSLPPAATTAWLFAAPVAIAAGFPRSRWRDGAIWASQMYAYKNAFELPSDDERGQRERAHIDYPHVLDTLIGGGTPPSRRLQRRFRRRHRLNALDKALTLFYLTWELEPHLVMAWLRWRHPERFAAAAGRLAATFDLTLVGYWAVPTAPPWWASEEAGRMRGQVRRVMVEVIRWIKGKSHPARGEHSVGANKFASMPSDHFASAAMVAMVLGDQGPAFGVLGWTYALLLAFALVYLGEHYVTDLVAGLGLALAVQASRAPAERAAQAILDLGPEDTG
jgi:membrane-associated phospholipid phosphatase